MKKLLFYDVEIAKCIPDKYNAPLPKYQYCNGWTDYENMSIACIGVYTSKNGYQIFIQSDLEKFQALVDEADEIIGFNSIAFDDRLLAAHGIRIKTTYDLLCEVRVASGQPPHYVRGVTRAGYSLERVATKNLGRGKSGTGEDAPKLWQDGKYTAVFDYCLDDVRLMVELWNRRHYILDPTNSDTYRLRGGSRMINLISRFLEELKRLPNKWHVRDWKVFFWAIAHSDISDSRIVFRSPILLVFERDWRGKTIGLRLRAPSLNVWLPSSIYRDYNNAQPKNPVALLRGELKQDDQDPEIIPF